MATHVPVVTTNESVCFEQYILLMSVIFVVFISLATISMQLLDTITSV